MNFLLDFIFTINLWRKNISGIHYINEKVVLRFEFKFDDLTKGENILTKIKSHINEELKKNASDLTFDTNFVKIGIDYMIFHPPAVGEKMMEAYYAERDRYR